MATLSAPVRIPLGKVAERRVEDFWLFKILTDVATFVALFLNRAAYGRATLVAGVTTITDQRLKATSQVLLSYETISGTPGTLSAPVNSRIPGSINVTSSAGAADNSTIIYQVVNP